MSRRVVQIFTAASCLLAPWILWLSHTLPVSHTDRRWNVAWIGFDAGLCVALAFTAYLGWRRSGWVIMAATVSATLLVVDAWFDTTTAGMGWEYAISYITAIFVELPLAILALRVAVRAGRSQLK